MAKKSKELELFHRSLEEAGYKPGTEAFDKMDRKERVARCKIYNSVDSCWDCPRFDHCELIKARLRDMYGVGKVTI